jgi:hypothetical protein
MPGSGVPVGVAAGWGACAIAGRDATPVSIASHTSFTRTPSITTPTKISAGMIRGV